MATIDEFVLKNIGLWWRHGISRHCDEWKYIIIGRIFESEIILIPPSLKISESSSNGSNRNTDEVWWRYGISRSCDEWDHCVQTDPAKNVLTRAYLIPERNRTVRKQEEGKNSVYLFVLCMNLGEINALLTISCCQMKHFGYVIVY
jgi:hypothetical protein